MSSVDDGILYKGGNLRALRAFEALDRSISRTLTGRVRDANRLATRVKLDPVMRKRGR